MPNIKVIKSVISEYGINWLINRSLYGVKLKSLSAIPQTETIYEKETNYPQRISIFQIDVARLKAFINEMLSVEQKERLTTTADKACKGIIEGFSSIDLNYGDPINWQLNPLTGRQCDPKTKWYRIPDFDEQRGDIKVIWEASRFSHFITFARAYLLTGDEKYYMAFSNQLRNWLENNKYSYGVNYKCSQECSLRMINTLLTISVFMACGVATDVDISNVKDLVDRCYRKILSNFFYVYKCIKNNHTISELMGMIAGAWCCNDTKQMEKAYRWLEEVIDDQFTSDGGYSQFSFNYQRLALQDIECIMAMSETTGISISENKREKVKNAALLMYQCQDESGDMPNYGSNDGALIFPVTSCGYRDFRSVVNTVYALCSGKQLYNDGIHQEELLWFGKKDLNQYPIVLIKRVSSQFPDAGLFTLRKNNSWAMIVANNYKSRPAHMDQLHFDLWIDGINVFCDAGTYSYASDEGRELAKNSSHNTAEVKGKPQMNAYGPFMVIDWNRRRLIKTSGDYFEGMIFSKNGYVHKRSVRLKEDGYKITDNVSKDAYIHFHTPCDVTIEGKRAIISYKGHVLCNITGTAEMGMRESYRSLYYVRHESSTDLFFKTRANENIAIRVEMRGTDK